MAYRTYRLSRFPGFPGFGCPSALGEEQRGQQAPPRKKNHPTPTPQSPMPMPIPAPHTSYLIQEKSGGGVQVPGVSGFLFGFWAAPRRVPSTHRAPPAVFLTCSLRSASLLRRRVRSSNPGGINHQLDAVRDLDNLYSNH
jgi:hypothetical protein